MDEGLERKLVDSYPDLYRLYDVDPTEIDGPAPPFAVYGFAVGDGWYDLLDSLSNVITERDVEIEVVDIKEKFGGLRFYHDGIQSDDMRDTYSVMGAIRHAEDMSLKVCEECGDSAQRRDAGYLRTLCDECWTEEKARRRPR